MSARARQQAPGKPGPHQATSPPSALSQERTLALPFSPSCSLHRQTWPCENVNDINSEPNGDLRSRERSELSALANLAASTVPSEPVRASVAAHTRRPLAEGMPTLRKPTAIPLTSLDEESHFRWIFTSSSWLLLRSSHRLLGSKAVDFFLFKRRNPLSSGLRRLLPQDFGQLQ